MRPAQDCRLYLLYLDSSSQESYEVVIIFMLLIFFFLNGGSENKVTQLINEWWCLGFNPGLFIPSKFLIRKHYLVWNHVQDKTSLDRA